MVRPKASSTKAAMTTAAIPIADFCDRGEVLEGHSFLAYTNTPVLNSSEVFRATGNSLDGSHHRHGFAVFHAGLKRHFSTASIAFCRGQTQRTQHLQVLRSPWSSTTSDSDYRALPLGLAASSDIQVPPCSTRSCARRPPPILNAPPPNPPPSQAYACSLPEPTPPPSRCRFRRLTRAV